MAIVPLKALKFGELASKQMEGLQARSPYRSTNSSMTARHAVRFGQAVDSFNKRTVSAGDDTHHRVGPRQWMA